MDDEIPSTSQTSWNPDSFHFPTESPGEPFPIPLNLCQHTYMGFHSGAGIPAPELIKPDDTANDPPRAFSLDCMYNFPSTCSQRQPMDSWNPWTLAQDEMLLCQTTGRTMEPVTAQAQSTSFVDPSLVYFPTDHCRQWQNLIQTTAINRNTGVLHAKPYDVELRKDSNTASYNEIRKETQLASDERDFGDILNRAMNRASGRLIALLQEELKRLSRENEHLDEIEETDEEFLKLDLDSGKARCRL